MSETISIKVDYDHTEFTPGDTISGTVTWNTASGEKSVSLRLFWFTQGRGTQEIEVIEEQTWPIAQGKAPFSFVLPETPYSFSGTIVSLSWALEAVYLPSEDSPQRYEFELTHTGRAISLTNIENPATADRKKKWFKSNSG